jgi:outer membrane lipoprotein carrier protein
MHAAQVPMRLNALLLLIVTAVLPELAHAGALAQLQAFSQGMRGLSARFEQQTTDEQGQRKPASRGLLMVQVPGRLRWEYQAPYKQVIVSDGKTLWIFDPDLAQATRRPLGSAVGAGPLALLTDPGALQRSFKVRELPLGQDGLVWLRLAPRADAEEAGFQQADLGFADDRLVRMQLTDNLGQISEFRFSDWKRNPVLDAALFRFVPPAGTDVVDAGG